MAYLDRGLEPITVHLAHYRPRWPRLRSIPPRANDNWMLLIPMAAHRFRCRLGVRRARDPVLYVIPPGFPFAVDMDDYRHYSAHFSDAGYQGADDLRRAYRVEDDAAWAGSPLREDPVTLRIADAEWRLATPCAGRRDLIAAFHRLIAAWQRGGRFEARLALLGLLALVERGAASSDGDPHRRLRRFADYLAYRVHERVPVAELAGLCGLSRVHLVRLCRRVYGSPPRELILRERLRLATQLLERGVTVRAAADGCGFDDPYYFSRVFTARFGEPPSRWAARHHAPGPGLPEPRRR